MNKNCRLDRVQVTESEPYNYDLLNRKKSGDTLLQLVQSFSGGFVMAINGKWGAGKTTFVEMWQQQMKNEGYETIYYNAWENDYISDPLIGIIAEFKKKINTGGEERVEKFTNVVRKVSFSMVPSLLAVMVKQFTGLNLEDLDKVIKDGSKEAMDLLNKSVDNYLEQQKSIKEFKTALSEYVNDVTPQHPLIFIIDELDRCKPDFAVKTLERIKHLFTIENVVFVLAIDQEQLCHSIRGYYGSDLIDSEDYLRRFIDVQYCLPIRFDSELMVNIFKRFNFPESLHAKNGPTGFKLSRLQHFVALMRFIKNLSIRQLEKWMLHTRLVINNDHIKKTVSPETTAFLVYLFIFNTELYDHIINNDLSDQDLFNHLFEFFHAFFRVPTLSEVYKIIVEILIIKYSGRKDLFNRFIMGPDGFMLEYDKRVFSIQMLNEALSSTMDNVTEESMLFMTINSIIRDFSAVDN